MTTMTATTCGHNGCGNRTTDASGRCHHHRGTSASMATLAMSSAPTAAVTTLSMRDRLLAVDLEDDESVEELLGAEWNDEFPCWQMPVADVGIEQDSRSEEILSFIRDHLHGKNKPTNCGPLTDVPLNAYQIRCAQDTVRPDVLQHYLEQDGKDDVLWDPDHEVEGTMYGGRGPLFVQMHDDSLVIIDGTHRTAAAMLRGDHSIRGHLVHIDKVEQQVWRGKGVRFSTADELLSYTSANPRYDHSRDDDPTWIRPVEEFGWRQYGSTKEYREGLDPDHCPVEEVPIDALMVNQDNVSTGAVAYYLEHGAYTEDSFDGDDGWWGNELPVVADLGDGRYVTLDGTSRATAERLRGATALRAHVVRRG